MADDGVLWGTGRKGRIFRYEQGRDRFEQVYMPPLPEKGISSPNITYSYMDHSRRIWLCSKEQMALFDEYGMNYHITPGISSFLAAAAALQSQFTFPDKV